MRCAGVRYFDQHGSDIVSFPPLLNGKAYQGRRTLLHITRVLDDDAVNFCVRDLFREAVGTNKNDIFSLRLNKVHELFVAVVAAWQEHHVIDFDIEIGPKVAADGVAPRVLFGFFAVQFSVTDQLLHIGVVDREAVDLVVSTQVGSAVTGMRNIQDAADDEGDHKRGAHIPPAWVALRIRFDSVLGIRNCIVDDPLDLDMAWRRLQPRQGRGQYLSD